MYGVKHAEKKTYRVTHAGKKMYRVTYAGEKVYKGRALWSALSSAYLHSGAVCCQQPNTFDSLRSSRGKLPSHSL